MMVTGELDNRLANGETPRVGKLSYIGILIQDLVVE